MPSSKGPPVPVNPAISTSSVEGRWACAASRCVTSAVARGELRGPLGSGEHEGHRVVERVARRTAEPAVPHQLRVEGAVENHRGAAPVPGPLAAGPDDAVALDSDRDRLAVAEAVGRRVASRAGVVAVKGKNRVEEEGVAESREGRIDRPPEPLLERRLDAAGETGLPESPLEPRIQRRGLERARGAGRRCFERSAERSAECGRAVAPASSATAGIHRRRRALSCATSRRPR